MSALRDRRFRRLLGAEGVSSFGDSALFLSLGIWAKDLTGSNSAAGLTFAALAAPSLIAPLFGHFVDRMSRMRVLVMTNLLTALALLPLLAVHSRQDVWIIYAVAFAYGVSFRMMAPAMAGLLKDMLPSADAASARALIMTVTEGCRILSPAAGAGIYAAFGGSVLALFDMATFGLAILFLLSIRVTESEPEPSAGATFWHEATRGFRHIWNTGLLLQLVVVLGVVTAATGLCDSAIFAAMDHLGRPASYVGIILSLQGAGSVLGGLVAARVGRRLGPPRAAGVGLAVLALGVSQILVPTLPMFMLGAFLAGVGIPITYVALATAQQLYTPARLQGRVSSATSLFVTTPQTLCIALGAGLVAFVDYRIMLGAVAAVAAACMLVLLLRPAPEPELAESIADRAADRPHESDAPVTSTTVDAAPGVA